MAEDPDKESDEVYLASGLAVEDPPVSQDELMRDAIIYAVAGLLCGLTIQTLLRRDIISTLFGFLGHFVLLYWDKLARIAFRLPVFLWLLGGILALSGFGALFFRSGPERGLVRVFAFGLAMMAGRLILMP